MIVGLRLDPESQTMWLRDSRSGEEIENLLVLEAKQENEVHELREYGRPLHQVVTNRRLILTVEVIQRVDQMFEVVQMAKGQPPVPFTQKDWLRVVRFPKR